ncbi:hypothetical protein NFJ02_06g124660 [Pycnococcus provasolii]
MESSSRGPTCRRLSRNTLGASKTTRLDGRRLSLKILLLLWKRSFVPSLQLSRALKETIRDPSEEEARLLAAGQRAQLLERLRGIDNGTTLLAETVARAAGSAEGVRAIAAYGEGLQRTYLSPDHLVPHFLRLAVETSESKESSQEGGPGGRADPFPRIEASYCCSRTSQTRPT